MITSEFVQKVVAACRRHHYSLKTEESYAGWVWRYGVWLHQPLQAGLRKEASEIKVSSYLSWLATRPKGCSRKTQHQALCALVFAYKKGLGTPLGQMPSWVSPPDKPRLPVWLSIAEFTALERHLNGTCLELAQVMFGAGLRLKEALKLRVRDIDFDTGLIVVRGGKGDKDRVTKLPNLLVTPLRERLLRQTDLWRYDRDQGTPGVELPDDVARKYPGYGEDWLWQWVFPAAGLSTDPRSGIVRRHHFHEDSLAKSLRKAAFRAQLQKRITVHTLRHSFATAYLANGGSVHELKELLGHKCLETTEIYTHCIPQLAQRIASPLDVRPNVVPFITPERPAAVPLRRHA